MTASPDFHAEVRTLLRDRLLDAARDLTCEGGWDAVTMARVARTVGVSRQSVYREFGSKPALGEAMVGREVDWFLARVRSQLHAHGDDLVAGLTAAVETTLRAGADNPLIKAILAPSPEAQDDLLPLLTTRPEPVLRRAVSAVADEARQSSAHGGLDDIDFNRLIDVFVRLTLSHLFQPTGPIEDAVEQIRWILTRAIATATG